MTKQQELWAHQDFLRVSTKLHLSKGKVVRKVKNRTNLESLQDGLDNQQSEQRVRGALPQNERGCGYHRLA